MFFNGRLSSVWCFFLLLIFATASIFALPPNPFNQEECPVCFQDFSELPQSNVISPYNCGHIICQSCHDGWIARGNGCPVCRSPVKQRGLFQSLYSRTPAPQPRNTPIIAQDTANGEQGVFGMSRRQQPSRVYATRTNQVPRNAEQTQTEAWIEEQASRIATGFWNLFFGASDGGASSASSAPIRPVDASPFRPVDPNPVPPPFPSPFTSDTESYARPAEPNPLRRRAPFSQSRFHQSSHSPRIFGSTRRTDTFSPPPMHPTRESNSISQNPGGLMFTSPEAIVRDSAVRNFLNDFSGSIDEGSRNRETTPAQNSGTQSSDGGIFGNNPSPFTLPPVHVDEVPIVNDRSPAETIDLLRNFLVPGRGGATEVRVLADIVTNNDRNRAISTERSSTLEQSSNSRVFNVVASSLNQQNESKQQGHSNSASQIPNSGENSGSSSSRSGHNTEQQNGEFQESRSEQYNSSERNGSPEERNGSSEEQYSVSEQKSGSGEENSNPNQSNEGDRNPEETPNANTQFNNATGNSSSNEQPDFTQNPDFASEPLTGNTFSPGHGNSSAGNPPAQSSSSNIIPSTTLSILLFSLFFLINQV